MDLDQQPSSSVGRSGRGRGRTSAGMEKNLTRRTATPTLIQRCSLSADTKMKILAAEMELLNDFVLKKHGVRVLNLNSVHFKSLHFSTPEMDRIKRSLDGALADRTNAKCDVDLDATLLVVKEEPTWDEEDTFVVEPGEQNSDAADGRADSAEGDVATVSVSEGSSLNVEERTDASLPEPRSKSNGGGRRHKCGYCDKAFTQRSNKKVHERTHTGEKPFKCQFCPKAFSQLSSKTVHERTHNGEKPFSCQFCPKTFSNKSNKSQHERIHRDDRPFSCELCDATFRQRSAKTAHMRTHTREKPFQCEHCEARFGSKHEKVRHMRIHTGEKPFQCEYCDKRFSDSSHLSSHIRLHTNEKAYACSTCGKSFNQSQALYQHKKTHHK